MPKNASSSRQVGFAGNFGDAFDEEIEDAFRGSLGVRSGDAPARKMAVDVHPGEAIDQRAAGDLHPFQVRRAQLPLRKRLRQRASG